MPNYNGRRGRIAGRVYQQPLQRMPDDLGIPLDRIEFLKNTVPPYIIETTPEVIAQLKKDRKRKSKGVSEGLARSQALFEEIGKGLREYYVQRDAAIAAEREKVRKREREITESYNRMAEKARQRKTS